MTCLFFGPYSPPITGQSLAFRTVVDSQDSETILVDTTKFHSRILNSIWAIFSSTIHLVFNRRIHTVYFTCTRSRFGSFKDIILLFMCRWTRTRVVNHLHGADFGDFYREYPTLLKPILRKAYSYVDTSIILTSGMKEQFLEFPTMKIETIPNFYPADFDNERIESDPGVTISFFSHLMFSKGIFDFLEAIRLVHAEHPEVSFRIAGEYTSDDFMTAHQVGTKLEEFLEKHPEVNIEFHGAVPNDNRFEFLRKSDILVLPTFYKPEAVPLVILEAMRCGNAIVATRHNYLPEIVREKNGCLISPRNPQELADAIMGLVSNQDLLLKIQGYNIDEAKETYREEEYVRKVNEVIDEQ